MLPVSLDCPFLIAPSVFSNAYLLNTRTILILDSEVIELSMNTQEGIILQQPLKDGQHGTQNLKTPTRTTQNNL
jgi:hypothetical protein